MKHYSGNPRVITERQFEQLQEWLLELGDLSGIVHDLNSDEVVSGNQRVDALDLMDVEPVVVEQFDPATEQGTVALGFYEVGGERYAYRAVRWTPEQCAKANIVANKAGGSWHWEKLEEWDAGDLEEWGFEKWELDSAEEGQRAGDLWNDMPELGNMPPAVQTIYVHFESREAVDAFAELIGQKLAEKTKSIWYPEKKRQKHDEIWK